jgi:hypothetical protein
MAVPTYTLSVFAIESDTAPAVRILKHLTTKDGIIAGLKARADGNGASA